MLSFVHISIYRETVPSSDRDAVRRFSYFIGLVSFRFQQLRSRSKASKFQDWWQWRERMKPWKFAIGRTARIVRANKALEVTISRTVGVTLANRALEVRNQTHSGSLVAILLSLPNMRWARNKRQPPLPSKAVMVVVWCSIVIPIQIGKRDSRIKAAVRLWMSRNKPMTLGWQSD
ncbi:hypothetical protein IJ21_25310 [Paenibacillus sp. 32O-W]|nr:hypothetical protein IJ21_25310 [Paenibacillus sp. 32O-W]